MLNVSEILKFEGKTEEIEEKLELIEVETMYETIKFSNPLIFKGKIINFESNLILHGVVSVEFDIDCYTCGKTFKYILEIEINEKFSKEPNDDEYIIKAENIDIDKAVADTIIITLPTKFVCKEGCKGICQICGKNMNEDNCNCNKIKIDSRLEKLQNLL